jgi:hypothetical protein
MLGTNEHTPSAPNGHLTRLTQACTHLLITSGPIEGFRPAPTSPVKQFETQAMLRFFSVIREMEIWRAAVMMLSRYAGDAEANRFRRAEELRPKCESRRSAAKLAAVGDHAGAVFGVGHCRDRATY